MKSFGGGQLITEGAADGRQSEILTAGRCGVLINRRRRRLGRGVRGGCGVERGCGLV